MAANRAFSDQFRDAVLNAGESRYRISKATGISESILSRFVRGKCGLSMDYMDLIAEHLGLIITPSKKTKRVRNAGK
jgi:transcriptional regulator with XRE-family HTH domain